MGTVDGLKEALKDEPKEISNQASSPVPTLKLFIIQ